MYLSTPYCEITTPKGSFNRKVHRATVEMSRVDPSDSATVVLDNRILEFNGLVKAGDEISVEMGYWGEGRWPVFTGYVQDVSGDADYTIYAKDKMLDAHRVRIVKAFRDATPNDVITYCVKEAGFTKFEIGGGDYVKKPHFVLRDSNVTQAITLTERSWGIVGWGHYIDPEGTFVWRKWEPGPEVYIFETGKNILDFKPFGELWRLHTFLFPWVRHSSVVRVRDMRVGYEIAEDLFRVERMTLNYGPGNSMVLWLRKLSAVGEVEGFDVWGAFQSDH